MYQKKPDLKAGFDGTPVVPPAKTMSFTSQDYGLVDYKYNEGALVDELRAYVNETYNQHYSQNKYQATEFIIDAGHGEGFCLGNILKYTQRYGKKAGKNRADLLKVLHYALIALHVHDLEHSDD